MSRILDKFRGASLARPSSQVVGAEWSEVLSI